MRKLILFLALLPLSLFSQENETRPNILLIVGDDMSFADIGPFGSEVSTPNLENLSNEGIRFSNFHATPVCSVTRSELLTGNNNIEVGLATFDYTVYPPTKGKPGYEGYLTRTTVNIAELLRDAGYHTYTAGKWHLGGTHGKGEGPHEWGFEQSYGIYVGGSNHWNQEVMLPDVADPTIAKVIEAGGIPDMQQEHFFENGVEVKRPVGIYSNDLYTGKMLEYLNADRGDGKPFFAYMAFTTAHFPIQAPEEYVDKYFDYYYEHGYEAVKKKRFEMLKKNGIINADTPFPDSSNNPLVKPWDSLSDDEKKMQARVFATYAGMIESQDHHIGKLVEFLKETDQYDNTLIIYLTDNGPEGFDMRSKFINNPLINKWAEKNYDNSLEAIGSGSANWQIGTSWANASTGTLQWWKAFVSEGGIRVPMIIVPPKGDSSRGKGTQVDNFTSLKELPMTILDYAEVTHPMTKYKDRSIVPPSGKSIKAFLEGKSDIVRTEDEMVAFELFGNKYVVSGNLKATYMRTGMWGPGEWRLYDIQNDPGETTPLNDSHKKTLKRLIKFYDGYAKDKGIVPVDEKWNPYSAVSN